ncbi:hypothetical protein BDQ17DRAFT_890818 [Cyathus striatus]|nr:hypothetical protein BDQ17DRAFT_890818 [Cyathus striatus]
MNKRKKRLHRLKQNKRCARDTLFPELLEKITYILWNSVLRPDDRKQVLTSMLLVNKHWKNTVLRHAFENIYFTSVGLYKWYIHIMDAVTLIDCEHLSPTRCRSVNVIYPDSPILYLRRRVDINWSLFSASRYPNLRCLGINFVDVQEMGPEGRWDWLVDIPMQVDTLDLSIIMPQLFEYKSMARMYIWTSGWYSGVLNIKHVHILGPYDEDFAWHTHESHFPNLVTIFCNGSTAKRPLHHDYPRWTGVSINEHWSKIDEREIVLNKDGLLEYFSDLKCLCTSSCTLECMVEKVLRAMKIQTKERHIGDFLDSRFEFLVLDPVFLDVATLVNKLTSKMYFRSYAVLVALDYTHRIGRYFLDGRRCKGDIKFFSMYAFPLFVVSALLAYVVKTPSSL